jgi:hypothetical protein
MTTSNNGAQRDVSKPSPPEGLKPGGRALWRRVTEAYAMRPDELLVLEYACRSRDRITEMRGQLAGMDLMVFGSTGQLVVNPLVAELRQHESHHAALLARLKLADVDAEASGGKANTQRENAKVRWLVPAEANGTSS